MPLVEVRSMILPDSPALPGANDAELLMLGIGDTLVRCVVGLRLQRLEETVALRLAELLALAADGATTVHGIEHRPLLADDS